MRQCDVYENTTIIISVDSEEQKRQVCFVDVGCQA